MNPTALEHDRPRELLAVRLFRFLHNARLALRLAHAREARLPEFEARVVHVVGREGATISQLATILDADKAQVSRSASRLSDLGLVHRQGLRAPARLTAEGERVLGRIARVMKAHEAAYLRHLPDRGRAVLIEVADAVAANALARLDPEEAEWLRVRDEVLGGRARRSEPAPAEPVAGRLITLVGLVNRAMVQPVRATSGLSALQTRVLMQIGDHTPLKLAGLIARMERDKAQIGRIAKGLAEAGLIVRERNPVVLVPTPAGAALHARLLAEGVRIDEALLQGVTPADAAAFAEVLDRMTANAQQLLAEEEALTT